MFGVAPPQTLYHTRHTPDNASSSQSPITFHSYKYTPASSLSPTRNVSQAPYKGKSKKKDKAGRPGTSESSKPLVASPIDEQPNTTFSMSNVYLHYQHSLNSLNDIIDRVSFSVSSSENLFSELMNVYRKTESPLQSCTTSSAIVVNSLLRL